MGKRRPPEDLGTEDSLFLEAMSGLGKAPMSEEDRIFDEAMSGRPAPGLVAEETDERIVIEDERDARLQDEDALFAATVATLGPPPVERPAERSDGGRPRPGVAGTRKTLLRRIRQGVVAPERTIDLHGFARDGAKSLLVGKVRGARAEGLRLILVITGRGNHSSGDAVLRQLVPQWLRVELGAEVQELVKPPAAMGGEGAILVVLRPTPSEHV